MPVITWKQYLMQLQTHCPDIVPIHTIFLGESGLWGTNSQQHILASQAKKVSLVWGWADICTTVAYPRLSFPENIQNTGSVVDGISIMHEIYNIYSKMDSEKLWKRAFKKIEATLSLSTDYITSIFLKIVLLKFDCVYSWSLCFLCKSKSHSKHSVRECYSLLPKFDLCFPYVIFFES